MRNEYENFSFKRKTERIDWRKLASIDVDKLRRDADIESLQENIRNITYCNLEQEFDISLDPNFTKLFRLAQCIIEYLLHCQNYLSTNATKLEEDLDKATEVLKNTKEMVDRLNAEVNELKSDNRKQKLILDKQKELLLKNRREHSPEICPHCPKSFVNDQFLMCHLTRRHTDSPYAHYTKKQFPVYQIDQLNSQVAKLEEKLKQSEALLKERELEKQQLNADLIPIQKVQNSLKELELRKEVEQWQLIQENKHKDEIANMKEFFQQEIQKLHQQPSEIVAPPRTSTPICLSPVNTTRDLDILEQVQRQESEIRLLQEQLRSQLNMNTGNVEGRLEAQERYWRGKMKELYNKHEEDTNRLDEMFQTNQQKGLIVQARYEAQINELISQAKEQREDKKKIIKQTEKEHASPKKLKRKEEPLMDNTVTLMAKNPSTVVSRHSVSFVDTLDKSDSDSSVENVTPADDSISSESSDETITPARVSADEHVYMSPSNSFDDLITWQPSRLESALRQKPNILKSFRPDIEDVFLTRVMAVGVKRDATKMKTKTLNATLCNLEKNRRTMIQKFPDFLTLREALERQVDTRSRRNLKAAKLELPNKTTRVVKSPLKRFIGTVKQNFMDRSKGLKSKKAGKGAMKANSGNISTGISTPVRLHSTNIHSAPSTAKQPRKSYTDSNEEGRLVRSASLMMPSNSKKDAKDRWTEPLNNDTFTVSDEKPIFRKLHFSEATTNSQDITEDFINQEEELSSTDDEMDGYLKPILKEQSVAEKPYEITKEIKAKDTNVARLAQVIQTQLSGHRHKPVGGVSIVDKLSDGDSISLPDLSEDYVTFTKENRGHQSTRSSSNTLHTSLWASSVDVGKSTPRDPDISTLPKPAPRQLSKDVRTKQIDSWDSDLDNISNL